MQNSDQQDLQHDCFLKWMDLQHDCFLKWMNLQQQDLKELLQALNLHADRYEHDTPELTQLVHKNITHFQNYINQRITLAQKNISAYFSPTWCTSLENSMLWAGGCWPSVFIRLINALSGSEVGSYLDENLPGPRSRGLNDLSTVQINSITSLQIKTVRKEDELSTKLANLQEEMADLPMAIIARKIRQGEYNQEVKEALNEHSMCMESLLEEADNLRLDTLKEIISLLTPIQAVDFLAAAKKLHLLFHAWGRKREEEKNGSKSSTF